MLNRHECPYSDYHLTLHFEVFATFMLLTIEDFLIVGRGGRAVGRLFTRPTSGRTVRLYVRLDPPNRSGFRPTPSDEPEGSAVPLF
jgi:hypothetical protein